MPRIAGKLTPLHKRILQEWAKGGRSRNEVARRVKCARKSVSNALAHPEAEDYLAEVRRQQARARVDRSALQATQAELLEAVAAGEHERAEELRERLRAALQAEALANGSPAPGTAPHHRDTPPLSMAERVVKWAELDAIRQENRSDTWQAEFEHLRPEPHIADDFYRMLDLLREEQRRATLATAVERYRATGSPLDRMAVRAFSRPTGHVLDCPGASICGVCRKAGELLAELDREAA